MVLMECRTESLEYPSVVLGSDYLSLSFFAVLFLSGILEKRARRHGEWRRLGHLNNSQVFAEVTTITANVQPLSLVAC